MQAKFGGHFDPNDIYGVNTRYEVAEEVKLEDELPPAYKRMLARQRRRDEKLKTEEEDHQARESAAQVSSAIGPSSIQKDLQKKV